MTQINSKPVYARPDSKKLQGYAHTLGTRDARSLSALDGAMLQLMLNHPFYASLLIESQVVKINPGTAGVDGRNLFICDEWFDALDAAWRLGVLAHEALHVGLAHHVRMGNRNPQLCNIAMDCAINQVLIDDKFKLPPDACFIHVIGPKFNLDAALIVSLKNASWEEIYYHLAQSQAKQPPQPPQDEDENEGDGGEEQDSGDGPGDEGEAEDEGEAGTEAKGNPGKATSDKPAQGDDEGEGAGDAEGDDEAPEASDKPADGAGKPGKSNGPGDHPAQQSWGNVTPAEDLSETEIEAEIMEATRKMETAIAEAIIREKATDAQKGAVKSNSTPRKDWKALLRAWFIKGHTVRGYTFAKLPRRPNTYRLPVALTEGAPRIIVLLDKSGSIGPAATQAYIDELNGIMNEACPSEVVLIPFDHAAYDETVFACGEEIDYTYQSGGGTNFAQAFAAAEEFWNPGDKVVMFTDMECSMPPEPAFGNDLLWVAVDPHYWGGKPTYGELIEIARHEI